MTNRISEGHEMRVHQYNSAQRQREQDAQTFQDEPVPSGDDEQKSRNAKNDNAMFLYTVVIIILFEFVAIVGAVVYSITASQRSETGTMQFQFPWLGFLITAVLIPIVVLLILHLVTLVLNRDEEGRRAAESEIGTRATRFFAIVRSAPTIIILVGVAMLGASLYYLDGIMALALKLADSFGDVAVWLIGAFAVAFCIKGITQAIYRYKIRQMEEEYAFRRDVFERTGNVILDAKYALNRDARQVQTCIDASCAERSLPEHTTHEGEKDCRESIQTSV